MHVYDLIQNCSRSHFLADTMRTEVAYLAVRVLGGGGE